MTDLPAHVRSAFHVESGDATPLGPSWDYGWKVNLTVLSQVTNPDAAAWSAKVRDSLNTQGVRVVRPVRSTDGRYVVSGWCASSFVGGEPALRIDETVSAALRLADALSEVSPPAFLEETPETPWSDADIFKIADRAAWSDDPVTVISPGLTGEGDGAAAPNVVFALKLATRLTGLIPPTHTPDQVGHADMLATTLFSGTLAPVVTDIVPVYHPHAYTAAQVIVDGLLLDAVDEGIINRFSHLPDIIALLMRALLYRVYIHALHPAALPEAEERLQRVAGILIGRP